MLIQHFAVMVSPTAAAEQALNSSYVKFSLLALSSIFFLVDPFAAIPSFIAITSDVEPARRRRMAWKAALTCFIVLITFALAGQYIFSLFGIKLPAFEIAGGLILLLIGIDMMQARRSPTQESQEETQEAAAKEDAGIVPLGIPMLAGPGAISSVMVLVGEAPDHWQMMAILGSIAITAFVSYLVLSGADRIRRFLGETGIRILVRIMGLLLVALAMQFFVNGLTDLGLIQRH
ncbi:MAG TPA: MarC family protein [Acidobacteriaceae bacterium]|nr:MarC family protein [Acidobacteriaceae bacterium]